jgi:four helix bundle protein
LIQFAALAIEVAVALPSSFAGNHLANQLIRSGTSPALNYAEAQGAESRKDFIHKMKISLKELRETYCCLRIIKKMSWIDEDKITRMINENNQLISIFVKSIQTAKINNSTFKLNK